MPVDKEAESSEELAKRLATVHWQLVGNEISVRMAAAKQYENLREDVEFEVGDLIMGFYPRLKWKGQEIEDLMPRTVENRSSFDTNIIHSSLQNPL